MGINFREGAPNGPQRRQFGRGGFNLGKTVRVFSTELAATGVIVEIRKGERLVRIESVTKGNLEEGEERWFRMEFLRSEILKERRVRSRRGTVQELVEIMYAIYQDNYPKEDKRFKTLHIVLKPDIDEVLVKNTNGDIFEELLWEIRNFDKPKEQ